MQTQNRTQDKRNSSGESDDSGTMTADRSDSMNMPAATSEDHSGMSGNLYNSAMNKNSMSGDSNDSAMNKKGMTGEGIDRNHQSHTASNTDADSQTVVTDSQNKRKY